MKADFILIICIVACSYNENKETNREIQNKDQKHE